VSSAVTGSGDAPAPGSALGRRLRQARVASGMSIREMGRRVHVSPSFISQVELGRAAPSIGTLYAIASELNLSLDSLMNADAAGVVEEAPLEVLTAAGAGGAGDEATAEVTSDVAAQDAGEDRAVADGPVPFRPTVVAPREVRLSPGYQRAEDRPSIKLGDVTWERLTANDDPNIEFLRITYPPGSESCRPDNLMHHNGWEYGHVLSGALDVQVSFRSTTLRTGDSIDFDSTHPHRLSNPRAETCVAIWIVIGRQSRS
jgi:transcriptional regulator with XRE-family HTH domain/mannose-6-phosphate isomerase-like protein (cupin superfamily)